MSFDSDLKIDLMSLETEWMNQPLFFKKYSDLWVEAKSNVDSLKAKLERKGASLFIGIKESPHKYTDSTKVTEEFVKSLVIVDKDYQLLQKRLNDATKEMNLLNSAKTAFEQRKTALEYLVRLFLSNYWAERDGVTGEEKENYKEVVNKEFDKDFSEKVTDRLRRVRNKHKKEL